MESGCRGIIILNWQNLQEYQINFIMRPFVFLLVYPKEVA